MSEVTESAAALGRFRPYPEYKDSGVEWIGQIPPTWNVERAKSMERGAADFVQTGPFGAQLHASDYLANGEDGVPLILIKHVNDLSISHDNLPRIEPARAAELQEYRVTPGDIVFSRVGSVGRIAPVTRDEDGWLISGQMLRLRFRTPRLNIPFALYAISSQAVLTYFELASVGTTRDSINSTILREMPLVIPEIPEQRAIAEFLDRETGKIDALVAKKERLIELLQEKRTALITHAVTKGLDPTAPTKPSGIPWLGNIPAHWPTVTLGRLCRVGNGSTPKRERSEFWAGGAYPWLTSAKINDQVVESADQFVTEAALHECHLPIVARNSVLMAITGEGQTRGRAALLTIEATISQHLAYISPRDSRLSARFLRRVLEAQYDWLRLESSGTGSTRAALTCDYVKSIVIPLPPQSEQRDVCDHIDARTDGLSALQRRVETGAERLGELRTALISAAVTGKIDVREEVA